MDPSGDGGGGLTATGLLCGSCGTAIAPPGGVMLGASTARLVEGAASLAEPELVQVKGADTPCRGSAAVGHGATGSPHRACRVESGGFVNVGVLRLRALLAHAHGDDAGYLDYRDRYRDMARSLGFEGHIAWAEAMP